MFGPNEEWDVGFTIQQTDDNGDGTANDGFIVVGRLGTADFTGGQDAWVLKLDPDGRVGVGTPHWRRSRCRILFGDANPRTVASPVRERCTNRIIRILTTSSTTR